MSKEEKSIDIENIRPVNLSFFKRLNACLVPSSSGESYYLVVPGQYCSCPDFISRGVLRREKKSCYHLDVVGRIMEEGRKFKGKPINTVWLLRKYLPWI